HPAAFDILPVGFLETGRRRYAAVSLALATFLVADAIEGLHHFFAQLCGFPEDRLKHIGRYIPETREIIVARDPKNVVQQEQDFFDWSLVDRYGHLLGLAYLAWSSPWAS